MRYTQLMIIAWDLECFVQTVNRTFGYGRDAVTANLGSAYYTMALLNYFSLSRARPGMRAALGQFHFFLGCLHLFLLMYRSCCILRQQ